MASSTFSSMVLFLLVLLMFPHIDMVLGSQMEHHKPKETNHVDQVIKAVDLRRFIPGIKPKNPPSFRIPKTPVQKPSKCLQLVAYCRHPARKDMTLCKKIIEACG